MDNNPNVIYTRYVCRLAGSYSVRVLDLWCKSEPGEKDAFLTAVQTFIEYVEANPSFEATEMDISAADDFCIAGDVYVGFSMCVRNVCTYIE